jgi:hypothetical protein
MSDLNMLQSPTGTPLVPPRIAAWLLPLYLVASGSGYAALVQLDASPKEMALFGVALSILGGVLGIASPGIRKAGTALLLLVALGGSGCATIGPAAKTATIECSGTYLAKLAADVGPAVLEALAGDGSGWVTALDKLKSDAPGAVLCWLTSFVAAVENPPQPANAATMSYLVGPSPMTALQYTRAKAYLRAAGY